MTAKQTQLLADVLHALVNHSDDIPDDLIDRLRAELDGATILVRCHKCASEDSERYAPRSR